MAHGVQLVIHHITLSFGVDEDNGTLLLHSIQLLHEAHGEQKSEWGRLFEEKDA